MHIADSTVTSGCDRVEEIACDCLFKAGDGWRILFAGGGLGWLPASVAERIGVENVVVYEANPNLTRLGQDIRVNGKPLDWRLGAVWTENRTIPFYENDVWPAGSVMLEDAGKSIDAYQVPSYHINDIIANDTLNAIVLDVEGAEYEILQYLDWSRLDVVVYEDHVKHPWPNRQGQFQSAYMQARLGSLGGWNCYNVTQITKLPNGDRQVFALVNPRCPAARASLDSLQNRT